MLQLIIIDALLWLLPLFLLVVGCLTLIILPQQNIYQKSGLLQKTGPAPSPKQNNKKKYTPIIFLLLGHTAGITLQARYNTPISLLTLGVLCAIYVLYSYRSFHKIITTYSTLLFLFAGGLMHQLHMKHYDLTQSIILNKEITATGNIYNKLEWNNDWKKGETLDIKISQFRNHKTNTTHTLTCHLLCYFHRKTSLQVSDTVELKDITITQKEKNSVSGNPTYTDYLRKQNITGALFIKRTQIKRLSWPTFSLWRWIHNKRAFIYKGITKKLTPLSQSFFGLIFLGNKQTAKQDDLKTIFNIWGLDHYLARSGLHIVLFIILWSFFLQIIPLHITYKRLLLILLSTVYTLLSWSSLSFVRALLIFFFTKLGELLLRPINFLHLLTLCCLAMLLCNPMLLFFLDFQLTFGLTFTLVTLSGLIRQ